MPIHLLPATPEAPEPASEVNRSTRRDFLASLALAGAGLATGCRGRAGSGGNAGGWYAWMADLHLAADPAAATFGQVMADHFRAVLGDVRAATDPPRGVVVVGDLAREDGQPGDYRALLGATTPLRRSGAPIHLALGNHDDRSTFAAEAGPLSGILADRHVSVVEGPDHRLLILDSLDRPGATGGSLGAAQRSWLAHQLDAAPETPAILFVHHHLDAHDRPALADTAALLDLLRSRRQAKAVVFGHTHRWELRQEDGLHLINLPAVGYRFKHKQPVGYCIFRPAPDGGELELRCVGGDRKQHGRQISLAWRGA